MNFLPKASGMRPRLACEITPQAVVAARSADPAGPLSAVARVELPEYAVTPGLKPGNIGDRVAVVAAVRKALEAVGVRSNARGSDLTLVIPDGAVRVLLLEFDSLPAKLTEALPIIRFRLKKLLPFEADDAMVSFQVMSHSRQMVRVLAVAMPRDVLAEYETAVREAGFEPGAVLPSTLAAVAAADATEGARLLVNASPAGVTTAIVSAGILTLHRSVDLQTAVEAVPAGMPAALFEPSHAGEPGAGRSATNVDVQLGTPAGRSLLPLVDVEETAGEWAAQQPLPEHGRNPYADRAADETPVQAQDGITNYAVPPVAMRYANGDGWERNPDDSDAEPARGFEQRGFEESARAGEYNRAETRAAEPGDVSRSPYAGPTVSADLYPELHHSVLVAPTSLGSLANDPEAEVVVRDVVAAVLEEGHGQPGAALSVADQTLGEELARAVSVATAYYEDTLALPPSRVLVAGPLGANGLRSLLASSGMVDSAGLEFRDVVETGALLPEAVTAKVPRATLAGVLGALRG